MMLDLNMLLLAEWCNHSFEKKKNKKNLLLKVNLSALGMSKLHLG